MGVAVGSEPLRVSVIASLLGCSLLNCHPAVADLKACVSPGPASTYKIFVDDVKAASGTAPGAAHIKDLTGLRDFIVSDLTTLAGAQASVRRCDNRFPADSGDFDDPEVDSLDNLRVLLEVWGSAEDVAGGHAMLGFVLVPAWTTSLHSVYVVHRDGHNFLEEAKRGAELRVFAPLSIGLRTYRNKSYEDAIAPLCQGISELQVLLSQPSAGADPALQASEANLLAHASLIASDAIAHARTPHSRFMLLKPDANGQFACPTVHP